MTTTHLAVALSSDRPFPDPLAGTPAFSHKRLRQTLVSPLERHRVAPLGRDAALSSGQVGVSCRSSPKSLSKYSSHTDRGLECFSIMTPKTASSKRSGSPEMFAEYLATPIRLTMSTGIFGRRSSRSLASALVPSGCAAAPLNRLAEGRMRLRSAPLPGPSLA